VLRSGDDDGGDDGFVMTAAGLFALVHAAGGAVHARSTIAAPLASAATVL
jgi:hypothetical protein